MTFGPSRCLLGAATCLKEWRTRTDDMWTTQSRAWERALVAECEAFFSGRSAQYLDNQNRPSGVGLAEPPGPRQRGRHRRRGRRRIRTTSEYLGYVGVASGAGFHGPGAREPGDQAGPPPSRAPAIDPRSPRARAGRTTGADLHEARRSGDECIESPDRSPHQPTSVT